MTAAKSIKIILPALLFTLVLPPTFAEQPVFPEGFLVKGGYGKLIEPNTPQPRGSQWCFEFTEEYSGEGRTIKPGTNFPLLESSTLQQFIKEYRRRDPNNEYRLWAMMTEFRDDNFLYPVYFLSVSTATEATEPLVSIEPSEPNEPAEPDQPNEPDVTQEKESEIKTPMNEPEDAVKVPEEILSRLKQKKTYNPEPVEPESGDKQQEKQTNTKPAKKPEPESRGQFEILADNIGYINKNENGQYIFRVEGFGRKLSKEVYYLQPCEILEQALKDQRGTLNKPRFRIAGIRDTFKGKDYLLLHRAQFKYSYGNFGR